MIVIGLDPGYRQSAYVAFDGTSVHEHNIVSNEDLLSFMLGSIHWDSPVLVIEQMQLFSSNYGVGQEIFDSVFWAGRFAQAWTPRRFDRILRSKVRGHLSASKGGDAAVRASLIDRFGPYKEDAIGTKKKPGPLHGIKADEWSALAIAVTWYDLNKDKPEEIRPGVVAEF